MAEHYEYQMKFEDGKIQNFEISIDPKTRLIPHNDTDAAPDWTLLSFKKCPNCQYADNELKYCPVAKNLASASEAFKEYRSFVKLCAFVKTNERCYGKQTDLQTALFSLFGLLMAASDCNHLRMFRSMTRFHLPFSTVDETSFRIFGTYLLVEYLKSKEEPGYQISMERLTQQYAEINLVNQAMMERIRSLAEGDASKNAIIILDSFCTLLPMEVESGLNEVKALLANS